MANLSIMYRIAADISGLERGVASIDSRMSSMEGMAKRAGSALVGAFTGAALLGGIQQLVSSSIEYADQLTNLSLRLKMSTTDLQKLEAIGRPAGVTLDDMARAASALYKNLDSPAGKDAIKKMGMDYAELRAMKPVDMFIQIGTAVQGTHDPIDQANLKTALFGKTFDSVAASMTADAKDIADSAHTMSEEQISALDRAGDAWDNWTRDVMSSAKSLVGAVAKGVFAITDLVGALKMLRGTAANFPKLPELPPAPTNLRPAMKTWMTDMEEIGRIGKEMNDKIAEATRVRERAEREAAQESARHAKLVEEGLERMRYGHFLLGQAALKTAQDMSPLNFRLSETVMISEDYSKTLMQAQIKTDAFGNAIKVNVVPSLGNMGSALAQNELRLAASTSKIDTMNKHLGNVEQVLGGVQTGWAQMAVVAARAIQTVSTKLAAGDWVGAIVAAGAALGQFISKLFKSEESAKVSPLRDVFFVAAGGLELLNQKVFTLTGNLDLVKAIFDAKTVEQYNKAIADLNALFDAQTAAMQTLEETAKKYGLTIEELGPAWQKQELDKKAQELYKDYMVLISAGVDNVLVIQKMSKSINEYVANAIKMGVEVPLAMKPMIEEMIKNGQLLDANGNKIENLEDSGIHFAMTMTEGFQALIKEVQKLTDIISKTLGTVIKGLPDVEVDIYGKYHPPKNGPKDNDGDNVRGMAAGGFGMVDRPTLFMAGEAGPEEFAFSGANRRFARGGGNVVVNINGGTFDTPSSRQDLAYRVSRALIDSERRSRRVDAA